MSSYSSHRNVPYPGAPPDSLRQRLDLFLPSSSSPQHPLLVFIHGGAWRSESKDDFTNTLVPNLLKHTGLPLAVLEYRLAPAHPHPAQINDVVAGLSLVTSGELLRLEDGEAKWDRSKLIIAGHSAGAFMAASLVLRPPSSPSSSSASASPVPPPSFSVPTVVRRAITGIICIDGIYDLPSLLDEYPTYASFVNEAFGVDPAVLAAESPARWELYDDDAAEGRKERVLVLHSKEDELLSLRQPRVFLQRMKQLYGSGKQEGGNEKTADDPVDEREEQDLPDNVEVDFGSVRGTHDELLRTEELAKVIALRLR
ncbi:hypothetical protein JCM8097_006732 [Rhodosporidiobolus ruineniae]